MSGPLPWNRPKLTTAAATGLAVACVCLATAAAAGRTSTKDAVHRAAEYVAWYDGQLARLVADERYEQHAIGRAHPDGVSRVLQSDIAWVPAPGLRDLLAVRDVHTVDGRPVRSSRIRELLQAGPSTRAMAWQILSASAAFNLGPGSRNLNLPTFALVYLRESRERLRWRSHAEPDGTVLLDFEERERPTIVRDSDGRPMRAHGRFWITPDSGRISRSAVTVAGLHDDRDGLSRIRRELTYTITVRFEPDERLDLWLPSRMSELYQQTSREHDAIAIDRVTGEARYTNYRRFETEGRIIRPRG